MGALNGKVVTCPMHGARFDVTTGRKVAEPNKCRREQNQSKNLSVIWQ